MTLKERLTSVYTAYVSKFEKQIGLEIDYIPKSFDSILCFGDYYFNIDDVIKAVDINISFNTLSNWYWLTVETKCKINMQNYKKREEYFKHLHDLLPYDYKDFHIMLLNEMIK